MSDKNTVDFTTSAKVYPASVKIALMFAKTCSVCAVISVASFFQQPDLSATDLKCTTYRLLQQPDCIKQWLQAHWLNLLFVSCFCFFYVSTKVINIFVACHLYFGRNLFSKILFSSKVFFLSLHSVFSKHDNSYFSDLHAV